MAVRDTRPVVAELGRPETPEETAARKAENSRNYRERKTLNNLVLSLLVCVGVVALIVFLVPRSDTSLIQNVDYQQVASQTQDSMPMPLAVPALPDGWTSNAAEVRTGADKVISWYIGLISPAGQFVGVTQAVDANPSWLADQLLQTAASTTVNIGGVVWDVYDNSNATTDVGNVRYALNTESGGTTYIVFGTAVPDEIQLVAQALTANVQAQPPAGATS
jgi:hypothetical protein